MWTLVFFDIPAGTDVEKRAHVRFRNLLLRLGHTRLQWSVYARAYPRQAASESDRDRILESIPRGGRVRILVVTDLQFERMVCADENRRRSPERRLDQVHVFE